AAASAFRLAASISPLIQLLRPIRPASAASSAPWPTPCTAPPAPASSWTRWRPMNPFAPVTQIVMRPSCLSDGFYHARRISGDHRILRNVLGHDRTGGDDGTGADAEAAHDEGAGADPGIVIDRDRTLVEIQLAWMAAGEHLLDLIVPRHRIDRMGQ